MNVFRILGDLFHVAAILILLRKMTMTKSCAGISLRTQILYLVVFSCRYMDLFWLNPFHSPLRFYNTIMKLAFIGTSVYTIFLILKKYKHTYDEVNDTFRIEFLIGPAALCAIVFHLKVTPFEIIWAFSIFLESLAIMPQLFLLQKTGEVENITAHYVVALGSYRAWYLLNWIWRYMYEGKPKILVSVAGLVQTALYSDFFYHYFMSRKTGKKLKLPP
ncbi:hypothetical protein NDN08_001486 [Rhodosorus marinus]|uniref:ER lumen protein-retaining receptor n=1 Tax=Rhodosorus marinus TaxID=101924 RepID=A0AAV8USF1_9RHOD|nr:hypothetical protein NDN08_001486 [Rhodosorus marinus]